VGVGPQRTLELRGNDRTPSPVLSTKKLKNEKLKKFTETQHDEIYIYSNGCNTRQQLAELHVCCCRYLGCEHETAQVNDQSAQVDLLGKTLAPRLFKDSDQFGRSFSHVNHYRSPGATIVQDMSARTGMRY
jgi:hypothetical protein